MLLGKRAIFIDLEENHPGLWPNDVVVLKGQFRHTKSQMRFISTETACEGGRSPERSQKNCHPLVIKFDPRLRSVCLSQIKIDFFFVVKGTTKLLHKTV